MNLLGFSIYFLNL